MAKPKLWRGSLRPRRKGAGTVGIKMSGLDLDAVPAPLGDGALLAGVAVEIVAVQAAGALADLAGMLDEKVQVEERSIITGMQLIHRTCEACGGTVGGRVGTILRGGNLTPEQMREWLF